MHKVSFVFLTAGNKKMAVGNLIGFQLFFLDFLFTIFFLLFCLLSMEIIEEHQRCISIVLKTFKPAYPKLF